MPTIASVTVRFSRKYQLRKDDWVGLEAVITLAVSEAEAAQSDPHSVTAEAFAIAKASVLEQRNELRRELQEALARAAEQRAVPPAEEAPAQNGHRPLPQDAAEAEQRFYARYGTLIGGKTWMHVRRYLGTAGTMPQTIDEWIAVAAAVRDSVQRDEVES